jgi:hypothetical protein
MGLNTGKLPSETQSFVLGNWYSYPVEINDFHLENYRADFKTAKILVKKCQGDP